MAHTGKKTKPTSEDMPLVHPHAAGIDVGAEEHWVCVPADRDSQPIQQFGAFTCALHRLADWLTTCRITTVGLASPGVYGMPLLQMLAARGFAVALVNARHVTHVPGRPTTERCDGRWRQKFQSSGWLAPSFRPPEHIRQRRSLLRPRDTLLQMMGQHMPHMPKALDHMHLHLHHVIRDVTGVTGRRMLRALGAGARDPPIPERRLGTTASHPVPRPWPKRSRGMTGLHIFARVPHRWRSLTFPSSTSPTAIRQSSASSARVRPASILPPSPGPHRRPRLGTRHGTHQPLTSGPISLGSPASTSRTCRGDKPRRSMAAAPRWASRGLHVLPRNIVPRGEAAVPTIRSAAATCSPRAGDGSTSARVAPGAGRRRVSVPAPALSGPLVAACGVNSGRRQPRQPRPTHWPPCSPACLKRPPLSGTERQGVSLQRAGA